MVVSHLQCASRTAPVQRAWTHPESRYTLPPSRDSEQTRDESVQTVLGADPSILVKKPGAGDR